MGTGYSFKCPNCDYSTCVSGGVDAGMIAVVETMVCEDCREVVNVLVGRCGKVGPTGDPEYDRDLNICPICRNRNLRPWDSEYTCSRCHTKMQIDSSFSFRWD